MGAIFLKGGGVVSIRDIFGGRGARKWVDDGRGRRVGISVHVLST